MPTLLLSEEAIKTLKDLVEENKGILELEELSQQLNTPLQPPIKGAHYPDGTIVQHLYLVKAAKWAASQDLIGSKKEDLTLARLLRGAKVAMPILPKPERSAELEATLRRIELAKEQAEYDEMTYTNNIGSKTKLVPFGFRDSSTKIRTHIWQSKEIRNEKEEWDEVKRQLGAIFNVALSVCAVAVATWWAAGNADPIWKTLVALPLSILVAVAEVALYTRHWSNVQMRKLKQTARR